MKREMKQILIVLAILLIGAVIYMLLHGNPLSFYFNLPKGSGITAEDIKVSFSVPDVAETELIEIKRDLLRIRLKKTGNGETDMTVSCDGLSEPVRTASLKTTWVGGLFDRGNGNFSGWQGAVVSGTLFFLAAAVILMLGYLRDMRTNAFSYAVIMKLALFLLTLNTAMLNIIMLVRYFIDPSVDDFATSVAIITGATTRFVNICTPLLILMAILLCVSNIRLITREGFRKQNMLGIAAGILLTVGLLGGSLITRMSTGNPAAKGLLCTANGYHSILCIGVCFWLSVLCTFLLLSGHEPEYDMDCIVILGCQIRRDGTLYPLIRSRVDRAIAFAGRQEQKTGKMPVFIPSGGKGGNEPIAEAEAMTAYLKEQGIPEERILPESGSTTTLENMRFSRVIAEQYAAGAKCAFSTSDYHMLRSGILAGETGWLIDGMGARTKWYFWPNALLRELAGLLYRFRHRILRMVVCVVILSVAVTYLMG